MRDHPLGVVAGVDGSENSVVAARWALAEARRRGVGLTLVFVWGSGLDTVYPLFDNVRVADLQVHARRILADVAERLSSTDRDGCPITTIVMEGVPGPTLVDQAMDAELLVVGSHGRGPLSRAVLGSVSTYCAHHAKCPTVVVPAPASAKAHA